ncbi:MAG: hypothetical protein HYU67_12415 [Flavobacteriia bacterium]|nr:hypothetical protein [Flavobacteriia bacterium]
MLKNCLLFILVFNAVFQIYSQKERENVNSKFRPGIMWFYTGLRPAIPEKVRKYDRFIIDVTYNDWHGVKNKVFKNNWSSIGLNTSFLMDIPLSKGNTKAIGIGLSYGLYKINQNQFFIRNEKDKSTLMYDDIKSYGIEKSVFKLHSVSIPLEIRFRGKEWKHWKFHLGGKFTYQFLASTVLSTKSNSFVSKQVSQGFYDLNPINSSCYIRFGRRNWALFAQYNFLPLFKNSTSAQLYTFQWGLSISLF